VITARSYMTHIDNGRRIMNVISLISVTIEYVFDFSMCHAVTALSVLLIMAKRLLFQTLKVKYDSIQICFAMITFITVFYSFLLL